MVAFYRNAANNKSGNGMPAHIIGLILSYSF